MGEPSAAGAQEGWDTEILYRFQALNAVTKSDVFPLPRIDDIMDKLGRCQYFTSIDLETCILADSDEARGQREDGVSLCGYRLWQYRQMAFGLKNSPATFQRCISKAIGENKLFIGLS